MRTYRLLLLFLVGMMGLATASHAAYITFSLPVANDVVMVVDQHGAVISLGGEGGDVAYDREGRVTRIGNVPVHYSKDGELKAIGSLGLSYDKKGRLNLLGTMAIRYDKSGRVKRIGAGLVEYNKNGTLRRIVGLDGVRVFFGPDR